MMKWVVSLAMVLAIGAGAFFALQGDGDARAEGHYQNALRLIEEGDTARANIELRNVFQLNGFHRDARWTLANLLEDEGRLEPAFSQLLRLVQQYPEDIEAQIMLLRLALDIGNWELIDDHYQTAQALAPNDPMVESARLLLEYRTASAAQDFATATALAEEAASFVAQTPELYALRTLIVDNHIRRQEWQTALTEVDGALALRPKEMGMHELRIGLLQQLRDDAGLEAHLRAMTEIFPDSERTQEQLVWWFVSRAEVDKAEVYLRDRIESEGGSDDAYLALIRFFLQIGEPDTARAEVDAILAIEGTNADLFRSVGARIDFDAGETDAAIAEMEDIVAGAEPSEQTHEIKVILARMLSQTGDEEAAQARIEEVLAEDRTQVEALKLKANWLIDSDETGEAIVELRRALDQSPRDAQIYTLLARAHERAGNRELMTEMLALAVEVSGNAPEETLRYTRLLMSENKLLSSEGLLIDALRQTPENLEMLEVLGNVYIQLENWGLASQIIARLNRIDSVELETAQALAKELQARLLAAQNRETELVKHLSGLMEDGQLQAGAAIIRLRLAQGDGEGALDYARELLADDPDDPVLRFIEALVLAANGEADAAADQMRGLVDERPDAENVWLALYNLRRSLGQTEEAEIILDEALEAVPDGDGLNWAHATEYEFNGELEQAIVIYERLYAENTDSLVFANNLASLLSVARQDLESLERAYTIARRLRGTDVPAFQDTYGWISYRLGNYQEALAYLEPAAESIPGDPLIRYHLGSTYAALGRTEEARAEFETALRLIEDEGIRREAEDRIRVAIVELDTPVGEN